MIYDAPHSVQNQDQFAAMVATLQAGGNLPPVVVNGSKAITGSHRIAAWRECDMDQEVVELSDLDYLRACYVCRCDVAEEAGEWNLFVAAAYELTDDEEVKAALKDQRHDCEDMSSLAEEIAEAREMSIEDLIAWRGW
jgi:hypothetical protein